MKPFRSLALLIAVSALAISLPLEAQTLYRCGKVFQDRPCDTTAQGKAINVGAGSSPPSAQGTSDIRCVQRADRAKKIMWAREVGKTRDEQLAASASPDDRDIIEDVYRMRGTSSEVSAAVEAKCNERAKMMLEAGVPPGIESHRGAIPLSSSGSSPGQDRASLASKKDLCDRLAASLQEVQDAERSGGSARRMDSLRKQRRDLDSERQAAGC